MHTTPRPPLTKRLKPGHWTAIDYAVGVLFGLIIFGAVKSSVVASDPYGGPVRTLAGPGLLVSFGVSAGAAISVATRRRHPMTSLCVLLGGSILVAILSGGVVTALVFYAPTAYVLYLIVATFNDRRSVGQALAVAFLVIFIDMAIMTPRYGGDILHNSGFIPAVLSVILGWSLGYIVRQRRGYAIGLQEEAASKAVAVERLRIARELHDVVAHSMSVIAVQAGYGQYVIDSQPTDAKEALGAIQATSREALEEMRRMLGALRYADEAGRVSPGPASLPSRPATSTPLAAAGSAAAGSAGVGSAGSAAAGSAATAVGLTAVGLTAVGPARPAVPLFPAPGLADLDRLLTRTAGAGVRAEVHRTGTPRELPSSIDLSAYRIVQEALTNVVKHAHASRCSVLLEYGDDELTIEVTDSGAGVPVLAHAMAGGGWPAAGIPSGGHGIVGMRERVSLLGGEFNAGPLPGYGFQVSARIPLPKHGTR